MLAERTGAGSLLLRRRGFEKDFASLANKFPPGRGLLLLSSRPPFRRIVIPCSMDARLESRLYENDSSVLIAVAPRMMGDQINLKLVVGYMMKSTVHGLPSLEAPLDNVAAGQEGLDLFSAEAEEADSEGIGGPLASAYIYRPERWWDVSPAEFERMPESEQRMVLRERYIRRRIYDRAPRNSSTANLSSIVSSLFGLFSRIFS